jgi:hypothetical protein
MQSRDRLDPIRRQCETESADSAERITPTGAQLGLETAGEQIGLLSEHPEEIWSRPLGCLAQSGHCGGLVAGKTPHGEQPFAQC